MKKIIIPIGTLLMMSTVHAQVQLPSGLTGATNENYIYTRTYLEEKTQSDANAKQIQGVQYFDGLGRPKQIVNVKASPLGRDVVTQIVYDDFGRQTKDYLPVPQIGTLNGAISTDPLSNATQPNIYGSEKIYSEKILENSPLDRILEQKQVGNDWNTKPVKFQYDVNIDGEVKRYIATFDYPTFESSISLSGNYGGSQLYKNTVTDEDGNKTIEFKNGKGQVLLVRKIVSATENADTYYVYNNYDQLAYVIPPLASVSASLDLSTLDKLCYQYIYDGKNRLVEKKLPGKGKEYMVYDKQDRLILTRDSNLEAKDEWLFTKYDQFSRPIYTGVLYSPSGRTQQITAIEGHGSNNEVRSTASWNNSGMDVYYTNGSAYPTTNFKLLSVNYYDTYPQGSPAADNQFSQELLTDNPSQSKSTKGLPVASYVKNIEDDNWTKSYTYYDTRGRAIASHSINHLGGYTRTESKLDFAGVPQTVVTKHKRLNTDTERIITENFEYDHQNRLLVHKHQVDSNPVEILAQNKYNELSQLESKKVGGSSSQGLQMVDYKYNIRGWMTQINDPSNLNGDLFGYKMKYNHPEYSAIGRFNGNISEVDWKTSTDGIYRRYNYNYDSLNRMFHAVYSKPGSTVEITSAYNEWLQYDLNGNITRLDRYGQSDGNIPIQIDQLYYTYDGNRLASVSDASGNFSGYPLGENIIGYDSNGNMKDHVDKGILQIDYNFLNLPNYIKFNESVNRDPNEIAYVNTKYTYRADGAKLQKVHNTFGGRFGRDILSIIDYLDGFQYQWQVGEPAQNRGLQFVPTSEGYFDFIKNKYIYNYLDHLGNVRLSYFNNGSGIEVLEENNYYPFGLKHENSNQFEGNPSYTYKYNGKELQAETGMYDYGARMYMPDLGRWGVVDPLAETSRRWSTYTYAFNNPINFIDPDGRQGKDWYQNNLTQNIEWHDGSAERAGETNLTAINNTKVLGVENGQTVQEFNLNSDGSFTVDGQLFNNGESATTLIGTTITSKPGFDLVKWLSHLGNEGGDFYSNPGGLGVGSGTNPFFRPDIDKVVDVEGYFGDIYNGLSRGDKGAPSLLNFMVDGMSLVDMNKSAFTKEPDTFSYHGSQAVGLNIYRGSGGGITGVGVKAQDIHLSGLSRSQRDSVSSRVNADEIKRNNQKDSVLRRIMKSR